MPTFDPKRAHIERFNVEWGYHATYTFYGLKGAIAERWAHGPVFNAVGEAGTGQLNLTPQSEEEDSDRLIAVAGLRTSALIGEGRKRADQARDVWKSWLSDINEALSPLRSVRVAADAIGLYPIKDEWEVTQRVKLRFFQSEAMEALAGTSSFHLAPEIFETDGTRHRTIVVGVHGPPHKGAYFAFENKARDGRWWLAARLIYSVVDEEGLEAPLDVLSVAVDSVMGDWDRISKSVFPDLIG